MKLAWPTERDIAEASPAELRVWLGSLPITGLNDAEVGVLEKLTTRSEQLGLFVGRVER